MYSRQRYVEHLIYHTLGQKPPGRISSYLDFKSLEALLLSAQFSAWETSLWPMLVIGTIGPAV